ncbi:MAG: hypothetical protein AB3A66_02800 [Nodularia sp. CChRGM 3473]
MAKIKITDLYPSNKEQLLNEITNGEMKIIEGGQGSIVSPNTSNINEQSLVDTFDQNLNGFLFSLRSQIDETLSLTRNRVSEELDLL